jgi:putative RNA 2'-phosphotransferase
MDQKQIVRISKFLSQHLRHDPEGLGLELEEGGWAPVDALLDGCARKGMRLSLAELKEVVAKNDKQRFSFDESGERIRANQGHSVEVDLQLEPLTPPDVLYHGTAAGTVATVLENGLSKMARHHVHLSATVPTARAVGSRHGKPVILVVDAAAMSEAGILFYRSDNGVWLVDAVPPQYLRLL